MCDPVECARFFVALLLSPNHFGRAKDFMQSKALLSYLMDDNNVSFTLPSECPVQKAPSCSLVDVEPDISVIDASEAPPVDDDTDNNKSKSTIRRTAKKRVVLVESEVRRSPRMKTNKKGFKTQFAWTSFALAATPSHPPFLPELSENSAPPCVTLRLLLSLMKLLDC